MSRILTATLFHFSGTCKMEAKGDPTAIVDLKLKIFPGKNALDYLLEIL